MDFGLVAAAFLIATGKPPLDTALTRTEPPTSLRAAFTVELTDGEAFREVRFDRSQTPQSFPIRGTPPEDPQPKIVSFNAFMPAHRCG